MASFDLKKSIEDSVNDGLIITITQNVKPPKASLYAIHIMKLARGIVSGFLVKDYAVYKKWIKE